MKSKTKKIMAMIMLILILCTTLPLQAFATFITDINSDAEFGVISGSLANYGHELHYSNYDGVTYMLFCTQYGITSPSGGTYTYNGSFTASFKASASQYEKIAEMIYFGYTMEFGMGIPSSTEAARAACATQQYVWEYVHNYIDSSFSVPSRDSWNSTYMSSSIYASWLSQTENYYNTYHGNTSFNGSTNNVVIGSSTTITDTTGRLAYYATFSQNINGVTFSHEQGSNDLVITVSSDCSTDSVTFNSKDYGLYQLMPNGASYSSDTMSNYVYIQFTSGSVQNLIFSNYVDPNFFSVSVQVESGNVLIVKTNTNSDVVANCGFELYTDSSCTNKVGSGTSDSSGQIKFERLATGTYYVKEVSVPSGYLLDTTVKSVTVTSGGTAEVTFANNEPTGQITIEKTDAETGNDNRVDGTSHHGDATLAGTVYTLYANEDIYNVAKTIKYFSKNDEIATFTFNEYGVATIQITNTTTSANLSADGDTLVGLPMGSYYSKETSVSTGYTQDTDTYTYTLNYKDMNTATISTSGVVENTVQKAKFEVIKVSTNTNSTAEVIEGAEFTAILSKYVAYYGSFDEALKHLDEYAEDEYSIFTTGSDGHGVSGLLAYGEYTVYETYTPSDEILTVEPFYIIIDKNSNGVIKEFIENDLPFESYLKMVKVDANTGKTVTLSNVTFTLWKLNEDTNEYEQVSCKTGKETFTTWTTDENGVAYTETKLSAGAYKIEELVIPNGFLELEEELTFRVALSNKALEFDEDYDAWITVTVANSQPTGTLIIDKTVALREDADTSLVDVSDLSGIKFKLTAKEDVIDMADGSIIYEAGEEIGEYNLDAEGNLTVDNLPMGSYELEEIETLDGLVLDTTVYDVIFTQEDTTTKVYTETREIENETTLVELSKTDITGESELEGATLQVLDTEENIIDEWVSGEDSHKIEGLKVGETYIMHEEVAIDKYVKATDIEFSIENTGEVQTVTMIDKVVEISKVDIAGEELEGATLQVLDTDGNVVDEWISGTEPHKVTGLEEGESYVLHEEIAIDGYVKATDIEFDVTYDKETQKIEMIDKIVEISKEDISGEELEGATLQVLDMEGNIIDEWVSGTEPHKVTGLEEGESYVLHEEIAIDGYVKATDIEFDVTYDKKTQKIEMIDKIVLISKTDLVTGEELPGAELQILDEEGNVIDEWTSTDTPHQVTGLEEGKTYTLVETTCPYGYEIAESIEFTVSTDKETQLIEMKDMPILTDIRLIKIDSETKESIKDEFTFGIYSDEACTELIQQVTANSGDGYIDFIDLRYGTYYVKEISAPDGYQLSEQVVKVVINDEGVFADDNQIEQDDEEIYSFEFENTKIETPNTGDNSNIEIWAAILVIAIVAFAGVEIYEHKKKENNKKDDKD